MRYHPPNTHLPRILCLHGAGSSGAIFRIQIRKIHHALRNEFRFVFVQAPFKSLAGPGMYPVFEGAGPFYRWHCDSSASAAFDITDSEIANERRIVREYLEKVLSDDDGAPFVGIIAFSQGTRVTTGLLLDQQRKRRHNNLPPMRFVVLLNGTYPVLPLTDVSDTCADASLAPIDDRFTPYPEYPESSADSATAPPESSIYSVPASPQSPKSIDWDETLETESRRRLRIPSVHVHGLKDPWLSEGRALLADHYEAECATVLEFQAGHHIATAQKDVDEIVRAILSAYGTVGKIESRI
jgi:predicted esterase